MSILTLSFHVDNISAVFGLYDRIQVWRSDQRLGIYSEVTAIAVSAASLTAARSGNQSVVGQTLSIYLDNQPLPTHVVFVGSDPLTPDQIVSQIEDAISGVASNVSGRLKITSLTTGTGSSVFLGGAAADTLAFPVVKADGLTTRIVLVQGVSDYSFVDYGGASSYWYKTRYLNSSTGVVSEYTAPVQGGAQPVTSNVSRANLRLCYPDGNPVVGRRVAFILLEKISTSALWALPGASRIEATTDESGNISQPLLIGAKVRVFIEGSPYSRDITVPNAVEFDLMAAMSDAADPFSIIQTPPMPIRVT